MALAACTPEGGLPFPLESATMHTHRTPGFTVPEMAAVVAIIGVLAAIATTLASGTVHATRAAEARAALLDTYQAAIRHAATRGVHVVACPVRGPDCADSIDWSAGWILFEDRDGDRDRTGDERVVDSFPALGAGVHLRSTPSRKRLLFQPSGGNAGSNVTFTLCDRRGTDEARSIVIANDGRLREAAAGASAAASCMVRL